MPATLNGRGLCLDLISRQRKKDGQFGKQRVCNIDPDSIDLLPDPARPRHPHGPPRGGDRVLWLLRLERTEPPLLSPHRPTRPGDPPDVPDRPMPAAFWRRRRRSPDAMGRRPPWVFHLRIDHRPDDARYIVHGQLRRGEQTLRWPNPTCWLPAGWSSTATTSPGSTITALRLISLLRRQKRGLRPRGPRRRTAGTTARLPQAFPHGASRGAAPASASPPARPRFTSSSHARWSTPPAPADISPSITTAPLSPPIASPPAFTTPSSARSSCAMPTRRPRQSRYSCRWGSSTATTELNSISSSRPSSSPLRCAS